MHLSLSQVDMMHIVTAVRWSVCMKPMEKTSVLLSWSHKIFTLAVPR